MLNRKTPGMAFAAAAALALGGCAHPVLVYEPIGNQYYVEGDFESATLTGELRTEVFGSLRGPNGSGERLSAATTAAMKGANRGPVVRFTPSPTAGGSGGYHVVMLFNPQRSAVPQDICSGAAGLVSSPAGEPVKLLSGFCFHDTLLSAAGGWISGANGTGDPAFQALVRQVTLALFPPSDYLERGGDSQIGG